MSAPALLPPPPGPGKWASIALSVLMHAALVALLIYGVRWQTRHEAVEVELVRPAPVTAPAPAPVQPKVEPRPEPKPVPKVEPKPAPPPKPDIALKEKEKPKPVPKEEPKPQPDAQRRLMEDQLAREMRQLDQQKASQEAEREARLLREQQAASARTKALAGWTDKLKAKIRGNIVLPPGIKGNPMAVFEVELLPTGEVLEHKVRLRKESGIPAYDEAVRRAILKSSPLPKPDQPEVFQRSLVINFCPLEESICR